MVEEEEPPPLRRYSWLDRFYWGIRDSSKNGFPVTKRSALDEFFGRKKEFKDSSETPEEYIARMIDEGQVKENGTCLYVVQGSVSLEFKIWYRDRNLMRDDNNRKIRQHEILLNYVGWKETDSLKNVRDSLKPNNYSIKP